MLPGRVVCSSCKTFLEYNCFDSYMVRCKVCGYPLLDYVYSCKRCKELPGIRIVSLFDYRNAKIRHILESYKFRGMKKYSCLFAFILSDYLKKNGLSDSVLVPVPCSSTSFKRRGWDHMREIAGVLERRYGFRVCELLKIREVSSKEQKYLGLESRIKSSESKFTVSLKSVDCGQRIIILDDICTTGMTLKSCSAVLEEAGYRKIMALTVFAEL